MGTADEEMKFSFCCKILLLGIGLLGCTEKCNSRGGAEFKFGFILKKINDQQISQKALNL
jgi:hypothetical protein